MTYLASILVLCLSLLSTAARAQPLTLEDMTDASGMTMASLSPDGRHIAAILFGGTNYVLILIETETLAVKKLREGGRYSKGYWSYLKAPYNVTWADNDVLAVDYGYDAESMDLEGKKLHTLGETVIGRFGAGGATGDVLVMKDERNHLMARCKARTAQCTKLWHPDGKPIHLAFDKEGTLRAVTVMNSSLFKEATTVANWYKPADKNTWTKLAEFGVDDDYWVPVYVPDEPNTLVIGSRAGRDTRALFHYDTVERRQTELLAGHPTQDILWFKGIDKTAFDSVVTGGLMREQVWFDPAWAGMQKQIDVLLPKRVNVISGDPRRAVLVHSYADVDPGTWYYFDIAKKALVMVGKARATVDRARMRPMEIMSYKAADGLTIPAYLTRPAGAATPAPMIVLIHGGPIARDHWEWDRDVQLFADRGYLVFQPQFRGSSGFGRQFEEAGFREWGKSMQDDITDGVRYLVSQGIADPQRICIVGASYGGYAALWGLVKTPDLYRCGISFAGVTDIGDLFSDWTDATFNKAVRQMRKRQIGDRALDAERFDAVSPLKHAASIQSPVLLIHGKDDERVPIAHGKRMRDALEANRKQVAWLALDEEGHSLYRQVSQIAYYEAIFGFLDKHLPVSQAPHAPGPAPGVPRPDETAAAAGSPRVE